MLKRWKDWIQERLDRLAYEPFEISFLIRQLGAFSRAGVDLPQSLRSTAAVIRSQRLRAAVYQVADKVQSGQGLSAALALHPTLFNAQTVAVVSAGERNGSLRQLLAKRSSWLALSSARRTQSVLVYSGFMMLFLLATLSILLFYVYPTFKDVFIGFGSRLPPLTRFYVWLSDFIRENLIAVAVLSALAIYGLRYTARRRPILAQHCLLLVPGVGALIESEKMSRSLAVVGTLIDAGMPLPEALAQAAPVAGPYLGLGLRRAAESIRQGSDAAASLAQQPELPALLRWYFQVAGERDVTLVLAEAAEVFEQRFKVYMENVPQILEMAFILAVGGIMGTGVVALFMPMFDMGG